MFDKNHTYYSYNDIAIVPAVISDILHRCFCNVHKHDENGVEWLPIFASPMSSVVNEHNFSLFTSEHICPILPRNISLDTRKEFTRTGRWAAYGLSEFKEIFVNETFDCIEGVKPRVLIDIANGHMSELHTLIQMAKKKYGHSNIIIMAGNIANPETYSVLSDVGCDYVRISIGSGGGCLSTTQTAIHYPIASLIHDVFLQKEKQLTNGERAAKIVADGGIRGYADVIKALALGADYVMIGGLFASLYESAGRTFCYPTNDGGEYEFNPLDIQYKKDVNGKFIIHEHLHVDNVYKEFYGMASRQGQIDINGEKTKTSEGVAKIFKVSTTIEKWAENMVSYLQSAMSYTNCNNVEDFNPHNIDTILISQATQNSINK